MENIEIKALIRTVQQYALENADLRNQVNQLQLKEQTENDVQNHHEKLSETEE